MPKVRSFSSGANARALITSNGRPGRRSALAWRMVDSQAHGFSRTAEEFDAQPPLLDQSDRAVMQCGDDQTGKAGAGAEIEPGRAARGEAEQLGGIGDVAEPELIQCST